jgi:hypothetical protein
MLAAGLSHPHTVIGSFPRIAEWTSELDLPAVSQFITLQQLERWPRST